MVDVLIKCNVGKKERKVRLALAVAAGLAAYLNRSRGLRPILSAIGAFGFLTAVTRYCPVNHLLGIQGGQVGYRSLRQSLRRL